MKLRVILRTARVDDARNLRHDLASLYGVDYTDLISLALESWDLVDQDRDVWDYVQLIPLLDPRHRLNRMIDKGKIDDRNYMRINAWLYDAIIPLREELRRTLEPLVEQRFQDHPVVYRFKGYLHLCDGMVVEIVPRSP